MGDTKKCKYCQSEIDKKAKVCPNCHKKQGGKLKFIIIVIFVIIIIGAIGSNNDEPKKVETKNADSSNQSVSSSDGKENNDEKSTEDTKDDVKAEETQEEVTSFKVGETASLKDVLVTLNGVTESEGGDFNKPSDGNVYALCEFTIENNSDRDIAVSSMISFEAYCDDFSVNQSFTGLIEKGDKNQLDGSVAAGKKMNGVIVYEVPKNWKELEINFTPDFWGKEMTFIATK